ncbi:hypothetical protein [Chroococcidiopsis sp. SAG 2025]|uniref:hypothetical protein n=1 Tax=Chroococcidiopsis sp. SAG 2025 TaxID=171389 RepID=UPI00293719EE|nr:hypothetical protein [Chroococcidiopsis sp. SAG 2025]
MKLCYLEGLKQHKAEGWSLVACEFNRRNKENILKAVKDELPARPTREQALEEYEAAKKLWEANYHNNLVYNPVRFIWR